MVNGESSAHLVGCLPRLVGDSFPLIGTIAQMPDGRMLLLPASVGTQ